jgi:hypothetical protein
MLFLNDAKHLILGTGQLKVGDTCVGLLKGDVSFDHEPKKGEVKGGFPQVTVKSYKEEETAVLSASLAEISKDNIELFLGQLGGGGGISRYWRTSLSPTSGITMKRLFFICIRPRRFPVSR